MRTPAAVVLLAGLTLAVGSCSDEPTRTPLAPLAPPAPHASFMPPLPSVRISELHYDNTGTDAGEAIEISGPAGMSVAGWQVVLYNGNGGASYNAQTLSGAFPATCTTRGVIVLSYPTNGIQNGGTSATPTSNPADADGIALVDDAGAVVQFISYEGVFTATNGPASGLASTDIGIRELGNEAAGQSLALNGSGTWTGPAAHTFGACNDDGSGPPPPTVASVTVAPATATIAVGATQTFTATALDASNQPIAGVAFTWSTSAPAIATVDASGVATGIAQGDAQITATAPNGVAGSAALHVNPATTPTLPDTRLAEIHYDNVGTDTGEAIEVEGPAGTSLAGWTIVLYNGNGGAAYNTAPLGGTIPALCNGRGVVVVTYPQDGIQNGSPDGFALVDAAGQVVELLSYEGTFTATTGPAAGLVSTDILVAEANAPIGQSLQRDANGVWQAPSASSLGACNGSGPTQPPGNSITFTGRLATDPALPVGFQDQIFATVRDGSGAVITTAITWSSDTPAIASIDQTGVVTALGAGSAVLRATAADGVTTGTIALPTRVAVASTTALYAGNTEFGEPADADPSDDLLVRRAQYTSSFNPARGIPNWVSYDLEATHFGAEDRCDCFTFDPLLPASLTHYTTADYTGAGTFHGFGIDRGHLARSFDRTSASLDNATTFYFSNIIPQASDLNQGPWAILENVLGDFARLQNREVYVIAGASGSKGTIKNEGKLTIPTSVWKVAVIMPRDQGLANIHGVQDIVDVIAVIMPNDPGVRNVDWNSYRTTVDAVEALSGYDVLALLPDQVEIAVESNTKPPVAATNGPFTGSEGTSVAMSAAASTDPDGDALTYRWSFGDGTSGTGVSVTHTYAQDGAYTVSLTATDVRGLETTVATTATIANVAPVIGAFAGATLLPGETYRSSGSFTDPGADSWSATVDFGDAAPGLGGIALAGMRFSLFHRYTTPGTFTVTVGIADDDATATRTATVTVLTPVAALQNAAAIVAALEAAGTVDHGNATSLTQKLDAAIAALQSGNTIPARGQLGALLNEIDAMIQSGRLTPQAADPLRSLVDRVARVI
jgi:DNA/RNA endonuclease G (NUC1)